MVLLEHASQPYSSSTLFAYVFNSIALHRLFMRGHRRSQQFVTHGGLFSKGCVTLDEIRKINRIGRSSAWTESLMCTFSFLFVTMRDLNDIYRQSLLQTVHRWRLNTKSHQSSLDGPIGTTWMGTNQPIKRVGQI